MKYITTTGSPPGFLALLVGAMLLGLVSQSALAVAPGITIGNTATLNYSVGAVPQTLIESSATGNTTPGLGNGTPTDFVVDLVVDVLVDNGVVTNVTPAVASIGTPFRVSNLGNTRHDYLLQASNASAGVVALTYTDNYDVAPSPPPLIYLDNGAGGDTACDGVLGAGELAAGATTNLADVDPTVSVCLVVRGDFTLANTNGQIAVITLKATTLWPTTLIAAQEPTVGGGAGQMGGSGVAVTATAGADTAGIDVVFGDIAGVAADAGASPAVTADIARDGSHSTYGVFRVVSASLSVAKVATVICDPLNGDTNPKKIPGAFVQYAITITNSATGTSANLATITDTLDASLAFDPDLISGVGAGGATCTSAGGVQLAPAVGIGAVRGAGAGPGYAAPGSAGQDVTAGTSVAGQLVTIDFTALTGTAYGGINNVLPANSYITVYFNAIVQ
jgi:hypothetical protein